MIAHTAQTTARSTSAILADLVSFAQQMGYVTSAQRVDDLALSEAYFNGLLDEPVGEHDVNIPLDVWASV